MPIKGLTEKKRFLRTGKIHLGFRDPKKNNAPTAAKSFVFPQEHPQYRELIGVFGDNATELRIIFPADEDEKIASQYYRCYSKTRGLICKGDGEVAIRLIDKQTGALADRDSKDTEMKEVPCQGRECTDYQAGKCREIMNLQFMLPEISGLGIWQIDTSSINSIRNINSRLELIRDIYGRVRMVPLLLTLEPIEVIPPGGTKKTVRVLNIRSTDNMIQAAIKARMEPLRLVVGDGIEMPVPDDDRPELVSPDWEGLAGEPVPEELKTTPEEAEELSKDLWPQPEETKRHEAESDFEVLVKEQLASLQKAKIKRWSDEMFLKYLNSYLGDNRQDNWLEALRHLTRPDAERIQKELQSQVDML